jgi:hypothetical protein
VSAVQYKDRTLPHFGLLAEARHASLAMARKARLMGVASDTGLAVSARLLGTVYAAYQTQTFGSS